MVRDYSAFFAGEETRPVSRERSILEDLGWDTFFAQQIGADELETTPPVRVVAVHRSGLQVVGESIVTTVPPNLIPTQAVANAAA